jgi:hypothetical protein
MDKKTVNGMPLKAIKKMIANPKTPPHLRASWRKKLKEID